MSKGYTTIAQCYLHCEKWGARDLVIRNWLFPFDIVCRYINHVETDSLSLSFPITSLYSQNILSRHVGRTKKYLLDVLCLVGGQLKQPESDQHTRWLPCIIVLPQVFLKLISLISMIVCCFLESTMQMCGLALYLERVKDKTGFPDMTDYILARINYPLWSPMPPLLD